MNKGTGFILLCKIQKHFRKKMQHDTDYKKFEQSLKNKELFREHRLR